MTEELRRVARRVVWFKPPEEAVRDRTLFLAHVMTYGTVEDLIVVQRYYSEADLRGVLEQAPAGVFDERSWAYWNTMLDRIPVPELPRRRL